MASNKSSPGIGDDETNPLEDGPKPAEFKCSSTENSQLLLQQSSAQVEKETPPEAGNKKPDDASHGNRFQSKLLMLYAVRAINFGYQFYLGTELPDVGDKYDDLIFHYKDENDVTFRQQYLQAKHRLNENDPKQQITANHLLGVKKDHYSLLKYFESYVKIRSKGNDIEHCIICTNVDFNHIDITNNGITLKRVDELNWPKLLNCKDFKNKQACYKLKDLGSFKNTLFGNIRNCITKCTGVEMKSFFQNCTEEVNGKQFKDHTADEMNSFFINYSPKNQVVQKLVQTVFDDFLDKLMFAVKTPNEDELDTVLTREVKKYSKLSNTALQSAYVMNEMVNWFKRQNNLWLTAKEAEDILKAKTKTHIKMIELTSFSLDYQKQLKLIKTSANDELEFEDTVINRKTSMLQSFWESQEKIKHFSSKTPKLTAVKVFSAIKKLPEFPNKDDYLVISSHSLKEKEKKVVLKESLEANINNGHRLLVVVDEGSGNPIEDDFEKFITNKTKKKIIVISSQNFSEKSYQDTITFGQLKKNTKKVLRERQVSFQGNDLTVNDLINMKKTDEADGVLDSQLIENLLKMAEDEKIVIPSFNTSSLENSLYIERKLKFLSKDQLLNKLADIEENSDKKVDEQMKSESKKINEEIEIDQNGKIEWKTEDEKRIKEIWEKITVLLKQINSSDVSLLNTVSERGLIDTNNKRIIITGVAGTGKSTILSHYYDAILKKNPDNLVIKISLTKYSQVLKETNHINDFFINKIYAHNEFARALLKHRLKTGERIIVMLDGFEEIDDECQRKLVQLVKTLNESIPLYITTRPHLMADKLQFELSQLPYSLEKFTKEDQIKYLTLIWTTFLTKENVGYKEETVKKFATDLIEQVSEILDDKEKQYCGIPLHCRILAECFQSKIKEKLSNQNHDANYQQFDLASLFKQRIKDMRLLFERKINVNYTGNHIVNLIFKKTIRRTELHLRNLAIKTIVGEKNNFISISPSSSEFQSEFERENEEKSLNESGIRFGLLNRENTESEVQFLHRSYAEYLVTEFVFNGFLFDEEKHNSLLDNESARKWIIKEMLVAENYQGLRVFFDSMLKEILNKDWKKRIQNLDLPNCLQEFVCLLFEDNRWYLRNGFEERNYNIVLLIFCCLDAALHNPSPKITEKLNICQTLGDKLCFSSVTAFCIQSDELTQQLLKKATLIYSTDYELTNSLKEVPTEYLDRKDFRIENMVNMFLHIRESNKLQQNENTVIRSPLEKTTLDGLHNTPIKDKDVNRICQMANKRPYLKSSGDLTEPSVDGTKPPKFNCPNENNSSPSQKPLAQVENETPPDAGKKMSDVAGHGNRFQSKLLMLYAVRAINFGYQFYLGTELSVGDKFDDLIFHFKDENDVTFRQQYLHVNHRLNENDPTNQIKAKHLLDVEYGDFNLLKYFESYVKIRGKGNDVEHCIICTNVDFDYEDIMEHRITLEHVDEMNWPKLLDCTDSKPQQSCYKIKFHDIYQNIPQKSKSFIRSWVKDFTDDEIFKFITNCTDSEIEGSFNSRVRSILETKNKQTKQSKRTKKQQNQQQSHKDSFKDCQSGQDMKLFFQTFKDEDVVKKVFKELFEAFVQKLIFAVKTPNEDELDPILTKAVGQYIKLTNSVLPTAYIMNEMVTWFKNTNEEHKWFTRNKAKEKIIEKTKEVMSLSHTTSISIDYQQQLTGKLEFDMAAIEQMTKELKSYWENKSSSGNLKHIKSEMPKLTCVKVISALKKLPDHFPNEDDYLVLSYQHVKDNQDYLEQTLSIEKCHGPLVVVDEDVRNSPSKNDNLILAITRKKKIILISKHDEIYDDEIAYGHLSDKTKEFIRSKQVSFQGNDRKVSDLVDLTGAEKIMDSKTIENLLQMNDKEKIKIPFFSSRFEKSLYIKRKLKFPANNQLLIKLAREMNCSVAELNQKLKIDKNGKLEWLAQDEEKRDLWSRITYILNTPSQDSSENVIVSEKGLIDTSNKRVIIVGVAGIGKTTIISHYYEEIKAANSDMWLIKIDLVDYSDEISKMSLTTLKQDNDAITDFFINCSDITGIDKNPFVRSLLKHRLETGDGIVLMLDGFDEINCNCQDKVIQLVKNVKAKIPLYITTRTQMADKLQFELSQLAYSLTNFTQQDQIEYLTSIWKSKAVSDGDGVTEQQKIFEEFAIKLIERVSESLKDNERDFIGVPLQCRILAECYHPNMNNEEKLDDLLKLLEDQHFDLASLYKMLFEKKRQVFIDEKIKDRIATGSIFNESETKYLNKSIERHLSNLAIEAILTKEHAEKIPLPSSSDLSEIEKKEEENFWNERGLRFGLLENRHQNKIQFLHRTYAEYLVSEYIYKGFILDKNHNINLLSNESVREWIAKNMLIDDIYEGVRAFFDSLLKKIVEDSDEWNLIIEKGKLPELLEKFASLLCNPTQEVVLKSVLNVALKSRSANILNFIFDCFDTTPTSLDIQPVIIISEEFYFKQQNDVFKRILNYFKDAENSQLEEILLELRSNSLWVVLNEENHFHHKHSKKNVGHFLDLTNSHLKKNREKYDKLDQMAYFFICTEYYELSQKFFQFITSIFPDQYFTIFLRNLIDTYFQRENWKIGKIQETLAILRDLGRHAVINGSSQLVLVKEPETFKQFYNPRRPEDENHDSRLLSEKDDCGMTYLHRAALYGYPNVYEEFNALPVTSQEAKEIYQITIKSKDGFTPLYVAAALGHVEICTQIIIFLLKFPDFEKLPRFMIYPDSGFLFLTLKDAIEYENEIMLGTILRSIQKVWDQKFLIRLLKTRSDFQKFKHNMPAFEFACDKSATLFDAVANTILEYPDGNGYEKLNELITTRWQTVETLKHVNSDTLQGMIGAAKGFDKWMDFLFEVDVRSVFRLLSSEDFLGQLHKLSLLPKLIDIITSLTCKEGVSSSYWADFVADYKNGSSLGLFLENASNCFEKQDLRRLILSRDRDNIIILFHSLIWNGKKVYKLLPSSFSLELVEELDQLLIEQIPLLVDKFLSTDKHLATLERVELLNATLFFLENGNEHHLSKFSQFITVERIQIALQKSYAIGAYKIISQTLEQLLNEKLEEKIASKYVSVIREENVAQQEWKEKTGMPDFRLIPPEFSIVPYRSSELRRKYDFRN